MSRYHHQEERVGCPSYGHVPPHSLTHMDKCVERLTLGCGHWPSPDMPRSPPWCPHVTHLLGRLTRKAKATVSRKLKVLSLYSSSPTEFSQHWCRGAPVTTHSPRLPFTHPWGRVSLGYRSLARSLK